MSSGIASIALFAPIVASNAVFCARRASRAIDAADENPAYALANVNIAAGQILKGGRAAKAIALASDPSLKVSEGGAAEAIKEASKTGKLLKGAGKVINFTAEHINPIIVGTSLLKVAGSDDKIDTYAREATRLTCMFGAEKLAKEFIGMPSIGQDKSGKTVATPKDGLYKKLFSEKQIDAMNKFFLVKKSMAECTAAQKALKATPGIAKGLLFVGASIAGWQVGDKIAESILGKEKQAS